MQQQINLYQPIFRKERKIFSARALLLILLVCVTVMMVIAVYFQLRVVSMQQLEKDLLQQQDNLRYSIESLKQKDDGAELEALEAEIAAARETLRGRENILQQMQAYSGQHRTRFSPYLSALSRQRISGLWLTHILIEDAGASALLRGVALEADLIPRYLQMLPNEQSLQALHFQQVEINRQQNDPRRLDFQLQTPYQEDLQP